MATTAARKQDQATGAAEPASQHGVLHLPGFHVPHVPVPSVHVPAVHVPAPTGTAGRVLWWGGLAAIAAFGVVDWPVVALVAAGSWVAEQYAKSAAHPDASVAKRAPDESKH